MRVLVKDLLDIYDLIDYRIDERASILKDGSPWVHDPMDTVCGEWIEVYTIRRESTTKDDGVMGFVTIIKNNSFYFTPLTISHMDQEAAVAFVKAKLDE